MMVVLFLLSESALLSLIVSSSKCVCPSILFIFAIGGKGPNYMRIDLGKNAPNGTLVLEHTWPVWFHVVRYIVLASGVSLVIFSIIMSLIQRDTKHIHDTRS